MAFLGAVLPEMRANNFGNQKICVHLQRFRHLGRFQSGQMGQTVNLLSYDFGGSNPSLPTVKRRSQHC
jgi:hypothetical protein